MNFSEHIIKYFNEFGEYASSFYNNFLDDYLFFPLIFTILLIYVLSIIISKFKFISKNDNSNFIVFKSYFVSSIIVATIILFISIYAWILDFRGYFVASFRFSFVLSLILAFSFAVYNYLQLRELFVSSKLKNITIQPISQVSENRIYLWLKKLFDKFKIWLILPFLSFLLLFLLQEKQTLVSIVMDASGSMGNGRLEAGKKGLNEALKDINPETTDFVISITPHINEKECESYTSLSNIFNITNPNQFCTYTAPIFENELPLDFINNIEIPSDNRGGFILYAMWQNYMMSKQHTEDNLKNYDSKIMVVASDFFESYDEMVKDNNSMFFDVEFCDDEFGFTEFYNENAFMINLSGEERTFTNKFQECYPNTVYNGYDTEDYVYAIQDIFKNLKSKTWYFIFWITTVCILFSLIIIFIHPKKLNAI